MPPQLDPLAFELARFLLKPHGKEYTGSAPGALCWESRPPRSVNRFSTNPGLYWRSDGLQNSRIGPIVVIAGIVGRIGAL
jgi:hypothetical protein